MLGYWYPVGVSNVGKRFIQRVGNNGNKYIAIFVGNRTFSHGHFVANI